MRQYFILFIALFLLTACGGDEPPPPAAPDTPTLTATHPEATVSPVATAGQAEPVTLPAGNIPPLNIPAPGPIRPGCGDYRLLVSIETDALGAGVRVAGPEGAVDVVWNVAGPGLTLSEPPASPRLFNEDNRGAFGVEANETHQTATAHFLLLASGVQPGQMLNLEMGHESPGGTGTTITVANTANGLDSPGPVLATFSLDGEFQTGAIDLCAAQAMPQPEAHPTLPPRLLAFFYPWWGTTAGPTCGGDASGWLGKGTFVTPHTPIAQDGDWTIYRQTACWMAWTDENGRTGQLYSITDTRFLAEQMRLAQAAGIDAFAVSTHGDNEYEMNFLANTALPTAAQVGFHVVALYEAPETGWTYDDTTDAAMVGEHLRRIVGTAAQNPAYLTLTNNDDRLVVFVDPSIIARLTTPEAWTAIRAKIDKAGVPYFLFGGPAAFTQVFTTGLDGVFNDLEVIETFEIPLNLPPFALRDERRLAYRATAWNAREAGMPFALPVVPGWDTALIRPGDSAVIPRNYGAPGDDGKYYRVRWEDALEQSPDWIVITSWNEWAEGTEIEPSDVYPPSRFNYLAATREYATLWRGEK